MGIFCDMDIVMPANGVFVPGSSVNGVIRYSIDEKTTVKKIIIALRGTGRLHIDRDSSDDSDVENNEDYVNTATFVELDESKKAIATRQEYETQFSFKLPENIPSSLDYHKTHKGDTIITCKISYNIRVKFVTSGSLSLDKDFKKEITVLSTAITPKLSMKPVVYGERKKLFQLFRTKKSIVKIKATLKNSVVRPGGKVEIAYEVENSTNLDIKSFKTRLIEVCKCYKSDGKLAAEAGTDIADLESKTGAIKKGDSLNSTWEINLPSELHSIENSQILTRCYDCVLTAELPKPHFKVHVVMPIQIGDWQENENTSKDDQATSPVPGTSYYNPPPPDYWQSIEDINDLYLNDDSDAKDCKDDVEEENNSISDTKI